MFGLGPTELFFILLIALVLFGPKRIPDIARSVGKTLGNINKVTSDFTAEVKSAASGDDGGESKPSSSAKTKAKTVKAKAKKIDEKAKTEKKDKPVIKVGKAS